LKKIKRFEIYQRFLGYASSQEAEKEELLSPEDKVILDSAATRKIIGYLASQLNKVVSLNSHLELDLGVDSLGRVELGSGLESILSIEIPQELIDSVLTVKELIIQIERLSRASAALVVSPEQKTWNQILNQKPPDELLDKIKLNYGLLDKLLTLIFKALFEGFFRVFYSLRVSGRRNIPPSGPYIFCPNHASFYDGFILLSSVPFKCAINLFFIGHAKIFQRPLIKWAVKVARLISIDPVDHLSESLQASRFVLGKNKVICIFPEGARSIAGYVEEFKKGVGILAKELNIPLLPVYIKGSEFAWPRTRKFPRIHPLRIIFGKPVLWHDLGSDYEGIVEGLRKEIIKLKNQSDSKKR
ncbi:MAG: 1-acyl-sn-glycerol-3-phosphate acyltransferase, partial [Candidatus Omnitrophica bacterium]|nr:1-acyl-sn-glycerol-3-phosphate acyltransferase [Candidatus Omnitrophota bacterium]